MNIKVVNESGALWKARKIDATSGAVITWADVENPLL